MNFVRCNNKRLFTKTYCYVDCLDYEVDAVAKKYNRPLVSVFKEMSNNEDNFMVLVFARIFKKDAKFYEEVIFPEANKNLLLKYGQRYQVICNEFEKIVCHAQNIREEREQGK